MAGAGESVQIGPFIGGLNTFSDETSVADNELTICENFELDLDGSLMSRPPFGPAGTMPLGATGNPTVLGYYYGPGGVPYLIASDGLTSTYYFTGSSWTLLTDTIAASAMAQFDGKAWLVSPVGVANPGGNWTPSGGFVADANMPHGDSIVAHKFRLWIALGKDATANVTRLYFSNVLGGPTFWAVAPDFIDIGAGDGQAIVALTVYFNTLIIFRTGSIYTFQYTTNPTSGTASLIVPGVGLSSKDSFVLVESYIYFLFDDKAYEFVNNRASQINVKVPFESGSRTGIYQPFAVSNFNKRIIFSFWDQVYVFSLKTRTWTTWRTGYGALGKLVSATSDAALEQAYLFSSVAVPTGGTRTAATLTIEDGVTARAELGMRCVLQTKNFNYEASSVYKRLFWWGVDAVFRGRVTGAVFPVTVSKQVTWADMLALLNWQQALAFTWDQPASPGVSVETERDTAGAGSTRKFVKFRKSLRFRQAYYRLVFDTDGSTATAPVKVFSLSTIVRAHERVSKTIT